MNLKKILLIGIIFLAAILRLWQIGNVPPSPDWDEAALGYNAYSIMQTGRDEYGKFLPVVLRSFDDYKPALYAYTIIPFLPVLGLTIQAVRLPSVIFGILTVIATYFLVTELFKKWEMRNKVALLTSFLLAISPWHIQFSRIGFETNGGLFLNVLTIFFFLKGIQKRGYLLASFIFGALNLYMYQSEKVFVPLLFIVLLFVFRKELLRQKKWVITSFVGALLVALPMILYIVTEKGALLRAQGTSIFSDQTEFLKRNAQKLDYDNGQHNVIGKLFDNRRIEFGKAIISGYISHWDLNWLFITGDAPRHHAPYMGLLYLWELPFLFVGMYVLLFNKQINLKSKLVLFLWFLVVPIPASVTSGVPHAVRTLNFLPTFQIFIGLGLISSLVYVSKIKNQISKIQIKYFIFTLYFLFFMFNFLYYIMQYFVQQNYYYSQQWQYGYKDAVTYISSIKDKYDKIVVENRAPLDQSYIFFLFYTQYSPVQYQKTGGTETGGFRENHKGFDTYTFRPIYWDKEEKNKHVLYVGRSEGFSPNVKLLKQINYLDGTPAIKIVEG